MYHFIINITRANRTLIITINYYYFITLLSPIIDILISVTFNLYRAPTNEFVPRAVCASVGKRYKEKYKWRFLAFFFRDKRKKNIYIYTQIYTYIPPV